MNVAFLLLHHLLRLLLLLHRQAKRPRKSTDTNTTTEATEAKVGFDFGDELENILGIQRSKDGFLCAYVSWYASPPTLHLLRLYGLPFLIFMFIFFIVTLSRLGKDDCSYVPTQLIALKAPQKLIAFYESHIQFDSTRQ